MKNYQSNEPCIVCGDMSKQRTYHHIKSRGAGGGDESWNTVSLCLKHHNETHKIGTTSFAEKYPQYKQWLINNGWERCPITWKWFRKGEE